MVMLSELGRAMVVDQEGNRSRLADIEVALLSGEYPPVTHIYYEHSGCLNKLEWQHVKSFDRRRGVFAVARLSLGKPTSYDHLGGCVLLRQDILDAQIIDLVHRTTTRATDLQLEDRDGALRLTAADASFGAMLRRVTRGAYKRVAWAGLYDWKYVEFLRGDPTEVTTGAGYHRRIARLTAGEIARLADFLPYLHVAELLMLLPDPKAADVLEAMPIDRQIQVFEELEDEVAAKMLELMSPDLAADLLARLHRGEMLRLLRRLPEDAARQIVELLQYPDDTVGGVMINNMATLPSGTTAGQAKQEFRSSLRNLDFISLAYVVEEANGRRLMGAAALRDILTCSDDTPIEDVMDPYLLTAGPMDGAYETSLRMIGGQLQAMPVTGDKGELLGVMTVDAAVKQLVSPTSRLQGFRVFS
jgi:magnesium transporter